MRLLYFLMALAGVSALQLAPGSAAEGPAIESAGPGSSGYYWSPSTAAVGAGGTVTFRSASASVPHGVRWTSGPEKPSCSGIPIEEERVAWSGDCTFGQAGTYAFVCTVHPLEMKGTVFVSGGPGEASPPAAPPPPGGGPVSPPREPAARALSLARNQRGHFVKGSVELSQASAGGRLEVVLLAKPALLAAASAVSSRAGRLVRSPVAAGRLPFAVPLARGARRALDDRDELPLMVQVIVKPPGQAPLTLKRGVVLHA